MRRLMPYIHQLPSWPAFRWDDQRLLSVLGAVRNQQGQLAGKLKILGFQLQDETLLQTLSSDVIKSSEIEGEILNPDQVRSSLAVRLGIDIGALPPTDRHIEGVVDMMLDATQNHSQPLTAARLFDWHAALFPSARSGMYKIMVAQWRDDSTGPMQVVSGPLGRERVHFQAPPAEQVEAEMIQFIDWFNHQDVTLDPLLKAGIAHFWFVTIHPFEDGNGRIARALTDLLLTKA